MSRMSLNKSFLQISKNTLYLCSCVLICRACVCVHACACAELVCAACTYVYACTIHAYACFVMHMRTCLYSSVHMDVGSNLRMHTRTLLCIRRPTCTCWHLKSLIFFILSPFSSISLSDHDLYASFSSFLQVLPPFLRRGSINHIAPWYKALTNDTRALVIEARFEPILHLLS